MLKKVIQQGRRLRGPRGVLFLYVEGLELAENEVGGPFQHPKGVPPANSCLSPSPPSAAPRAPASCLWLPFHLSRAASPPPRPSPVPQRSIRHGLGESSSCAAARHAAADSHGSSTP